MSSGSYKFDLEDLHAFLVERGFHSFKPPNVKTVVLVKVDDKKVRQVSPDDIREFCWRYIELEYEFLVDEERKQVKQEFHKSKSFFSRYNIILLPEIELKEIKDTPDKSYLFFNNCILEITADDVERKLYSQIEGHVFESDIINFDFNPELAGDIDPIGEFNEFLKAICKNDVQEAQYQNLESIHTLIGYLLHRHKDPANAKAIIFMDSYVDGNPNGGTGKGILTKAFDKIRKTAFQDGKFTSFSDRFHLSNVVYGTRVLVFDDVPKNFDFERIFPLITEKAVIERKYENKFNIPFEESPKVLITTNYTVEGEGVSHRRRKIEFIFSDTFNANHSPEDEFGHLLFEGWDIIEWERFFITIAACIQYYLLLGILKPKFNVKERKLKMEATSEFIQYLNQNVDPGIKYNKKEVYEEFYTKFPNHHKIELTTFRNWLKLFADAYGFGFHESHSGSENFFEFSSQ